MAQFTYHNANGESRPQERDRVGTDEGPRPSEWWVPAGGRHVYRPVAAVAALVLVTLVLVAVVWRDKARPVVDPSELGEAQVLPIGFKADASGGFVVPAPDLTRIMRKVAPASSGMSASLCLHSLVALGLDARFQDNRIATGRDLLRLFTDDECGRRYFGGPVMVGTRYGLRPVLSPGSEVMNEKHYDQTLGCLAQLGLPLTHPMKFEGKAFTLRDVLRDSIASFELHQSEIEWTAIAYAAYLPPRRAWENKFGETYTFDQLAVELLDRDLSRTSCCGCHVFEAVLALLRVDQEATPILSYPVRIKLDKALESYVSAVLTGQDADGSWGPHWYRNLLTASQRQGLTSGGERAAEARLLATSHIAHLIMFLPERLRVPEGALARSEGWILRTLSGAGDDFIRDHFCPSSHGAWLLRVASGETSPDLSKFPDPPARRPAL